MPTPFLSSVQQRWTNFTSPLWAAQKLQLQTMPSVLVTWPGDAHDHIIVRAGSNTDFIANVDSFWNGTHHMTSLFCSEKKMYVVHVICTESVPAPRISSNGMLGLLQVAPNLSQPILPGTRFVDLRSPSYRANQPVQRMQLMSTMAISCGVRDLVSKADHMHHVVGSWHWSNVSLDLPYLAGHGMEAKTLHSLSSNLMLRTPRSVWNSSNISQFTYLQWRGSAKDTDYVRHMLIARHAKKSAMPRTSSKHRRPRIHIVGDSLSSGLFVSLVVASSRMNDALPLWKAASNLSDYLCARLRPLAIQTEWADLSWMFATTHAVDGFFSRDPNVIYAEHGFPHISSPDLILIQSGLWDVHDREAESLNPEVLRLITLLRTWFPATFVIWLGPLHTSEVGPTWRTARRLQQHAFTIRRLLEKVSVPFVDARSMFAAINNTDDGRHYEIAQYWSWANLVLNTWYKFDKRAPIHAIHAAGG